MSSGKRYTVEQQAQAVAEYWLVGSYRRVGEQTGMDDKTVALWVGHAEAPRTSAHQRMARRAAEIHEKRKATLEGAIQLALDLQVRDLPTADFRDRTGFIKIASELGLLRAGQPTSISENRQVDPIDVEIEQLLSEEAAKRETASRNGSG